MSLDAIHAAITRWEAPVGWAGLQPFTRYNLRLEPLKDDALSNDARVLRDAWRARGSLAEVTGPEVYEAFFQVPPRKAFVDDVMKEAVASRIFQRLS